MGIDLSEYYTPTEWQAFADEAKRRETPCIIVNLDIIRRRYGELKTLFPFGKVYYAVKANPSVEVLSLLRDLGSNFDIASRYELDRVLALGIAPERVSYGNTIKKAKDIRYFYKKGVRLFCTDSEGDLQGLIAYSQNLIELVGGAGLCA